MGEAGARSLNVASKSPAGTGTERTAARGLNRRWAATLLLLAVLALIDYWLVAAGIERVRVEVMAADDAASQRILFQRTVFLGGMLSNGKLAPRNRSKVTHELDTTIAELMRNHDALTGSGTRPRVARYGAELRKIYFTPPFELDRRLRAAVDAVRALLDGAATTSMPGTDETGEILAMLETVGHLHAAELESTATGLARLDVTLLVANLAVLTIAALFVFRPLGVRVHDQIVRLERTNEELRARTRELEQARRQALQSATDADLARRAAEHSARETAEHNRELETMLYVISHDLREPLRAIEQFSQIVNDRYAEKLDTKGTDFLGRTVRAARRMRTLLDDLLELSRARRLRPPDEPVEGHAIVSDVLERVAGRIEETHAVVRVARDLPSVRADRVWAVQALTNLVVNALKFTCNGQPPEVEIAGYRDAGTAGFVVRDKGAGVAPEHAERIFRLFQRAVGREIEGTGAGLAIVAAVAERHGGRAWVEPREGGGSEFAITFADAESRAPEVAA